MVWLLLSSPDPGNSNHGQDPHDPLVFAPGVSIGSRFQYGQNVIPADWHYDGKLNEGSTEENGLTGFRIVTLLQTHPSSKPDASEEFLPLACEFIGTTPVVTVFAQNGEKHRFTVDTGALKSYISPLVAESLNGGSEAPFPMVLQLAGHRWLHFKAEVDRNVAILSHPDPAFPADGILGMNAISCLQLKIDYRRRKLWARLSSKPMNSGQPGKELGAIGASKRTGSLVTVDMNRQDSGRYAIDAVLNGTSVKLEVDTGANVIGLTPAVISRLGLETAGEGAVLVEGGTKKLTRYIAPSAKVGEVGFLWPVIHQGETQDNEVGGFGPSVFPHQTVLIDYPNLHLYTVMATQDELIEQAAGQLISGVVRIDGAEVVLDLPDIVGKSRAVLLKIQDILIGKVMADLRALSNGDSAAHSRLMKLYKDLDRSGHLTIRQDGEPRLIQTSDSPSTGQLPQR